MRTKTARTLIEISYSQDEALLVAIKNCLSEAKITSKEAAERETIAILNTAIQADNVEGSSADNAIDEVNTFITTYVYGANKCPYCENWFFIDEDADAGGMQWDEENESCIYCTATQNR